MSNRVRIVSVLSFFVLAAVSGLAVAQTEGPPSPDGPMQGLMRGHARVSDRFMSTFDLNHDGKVTRDEMNKADGGRFSAATHGAAAMTQDQFDAMHTQSFQQHTAQMFHRLDWNGDGKLSLDEYAAPQRVRFETMDREGKGTESCAANPVRRTSFQPGNHRGGGLGHARFCAENDLNRDGAVTRAEFDAATAKRFSTLTGGAKGMTGGQFAADALVHYRDLGSRMFKRMDANHDGKLSLAEFSAGDQKSFARMDKNKDGAVSRDELSSRRFNGGHKRQVAHR